MQGKKNSIEENPPKYLHQFTLKQYPIRNKINSCSNLQSHTTLQLNKVKSLLILKSNQHIPFLIPKVMQMLAMDSNNSAI